MIESRGWDPIACWVSAPGRGAALERRLTGVRWAPFAATCLGARLGIPSLYFSSLPHPLYHTPLDDPKHINYAKVTRIARWMSATGVGGRQRARTGQAATRGTPGALK